MPKVSEKKRASNDKYDALHFKHHSVKLKIEEWERMQKVTKNRNIPMNTFIRSAINEKIDRMESDT